jgi:hypothetical protein
MTNPTALLIQGFREDHSQVASRYKTARAKLLHHGNECECVSRRPLRNAGVNLDTYVTLCHNAALELVDDGVGMGAAL